MEINDPRWHPRPVPRQIPDLRIDGPRTGLWLLIPNLIVLGLLCVELREDASWMIFALIAITAVFSAVVLAKFLRPPRLAIRNGQFSFSYGFRSFRFPAADLADVHMQNRYVLLTLATVDHVERPSTRERMRNLYQHRGYHYLLPPGVLYLDDVNYLRSALGRPPQAGDPGGDEIDQFHRGILSQRPLVTLGIIAACTIVFIVKAVFDHSLMGGTDRSDLAWGANYGPLTFGGQWWRLITCMFLHGGLVHIGMNMYVLWDVGRLMERLVGRVALLLIYAISGMAGGIISAAMHPDTASIGASGAVFGVIGALFGLLLHDRQSVPPSRLKELRYAILIFIVLNFMFGLSIPHIDVSAHGGGAIAGLLAGLIVVPAQARGHWLRCAILALVGTAGIVVALLVIPRPIDFDAFAARHDQIMHKFRELQLQHDQGKVSEVELAEKLDAEVLAPWKEIEQQVLANQFGRCKTPKQQADLFQYVQVQEKSFEDRIAALRTGNFEVDERAEAEEADAAKLEHDVLTDFHQ